MYCCILMQTRVELAWQLQGPWAAPQSSFLSFSPSREPDGSRNPCWSTLRPSIISDLERTIGQYVLYHDVLAEREPERILYVALPHIMLEAMLDEPIGKMLLRNKRLRVLLFDPQQERILRWIPEIAIVPSLSAF